MPITRDRLQVGYDRSVACPGGFHCVRATNILLNGIEAVASMQGGDGSVHIPRQARRAGLCSLRLRWLDRQFDLCGCATGEALGVFRSSQAGSVASRQSSGNRSSLA